MIRWKYLLPRLCILALLVLLVNILFTPLAKCLLVQSAQSVTGAKVDVGQLQISLRSGQVRISELQIADPDQPRRNLLQADEALLELNTGELLHRRFVVERGSLKRVQFGTPRSESGALVTQNEGEEPGIASKITGLAADKIKQLGDDWTDQMRASLPKIAEDRLETARVGKQLAAWWPAEFDRQKRQAMSLQERALAIRQQLKQRTGDPFADFERMQKVVLESRQLMIDLQTAQQQIHQLGNRFRADQQRLNEARRNDQQKIASGVKSFDLQPSQITRLLLTEQQREWINDTCGWLTWFRDSVPDPDKDFRPERYQGFDVRFRHHPTMLVKLAEIEGEGQLAGQSIVFAGQLKNLSTTPRLVAEPTTFVLRGKGNDLITVVGSIDRRTADDIDTIQIDCADMKTPRRRLGDTDSLMMDMEQAKMSYRVLARMQNDQLQGQIRLHQSDVNLQVAQLGKFAAAEEMKTAINHQLIGINQFEVSINLSGTLEEPVATLDSDLGSKLATAMSGTLNQSLRAFAGRQSQHLQTLVDRHQLTLEQLFASRSNELIRMLTDEVAVVADLQKLVPSSLKLPRFQ